MVNSHLLNVLGKQTLDVSPWAMNHASMTPTDEAFLSERKNDFSLWLTTPRMLLGESICPEPSFHFNSGVDVSSLQQVIMLRPPNKEHAFVQVD